MSTEVRTAGRYKGVRTTGDEMLSSGSIVHWSERDPDGSRRVFITCFSCHRKRLAWPIFNKRSSTAGRCRECFTQTRPSRRRTDNEVHVSGAVIRWSIRAPGNVNKVGITCVRCGKLKFVKQETARDQAWSGRCFDCFQEEGGARPRQDLQDEPVAFGSIIHWSERESDGRNLTFTCGICVANGGSNPKQKVSRGNIPPKAVRQSPQYMRFCRSHSRAEVALHIARFQDGSEQKNGSAEKRHRGRKKGDKYIDPDRSLASLKDAVRTLHQGGFAIGDITYAEVAKIFQNKGEQIGADAVRKRFNDCSTGVKWRNFVVSEVIQNGN